MPYQIPAGAAGKGSGESYKTTESQREGLKNKLTQTLMSSLRPEEAPNLRNMSDYLFPALQTQKEDVQRARESLLFIGKHLKDKPTMAMNLNPLGVLLENAFPKEAKGMSKLGHPSPYIDKAIDVGKTVLSAENALTGREIQAREALLTNKLMSGNEFTSMVDSGYSAGKKDPSMGGNNPNSIAAQSLAFRIDEASKRRKERIGASFKDVTPLISKVGRMGNIFEKYATWNPKLGSWTIAGTDNAISRIGGPAMVSFVDGPAAGEFYQAAIDMKKLKTRMLSGLAVSSKEEAEIERTMGIDWKSNPSLVISGHDSNIDEIIDFIRSKKAAHSGGSEVLEYLYDVGLTIEKLEAMKIANRMKQEPRRTVAPKYQQPGAASPEPDSPQQGMIIKPQGAQQRSIDVFGVPDDIGDAMDSIE